MPSFNSLPSGNLTEILGSCEFPSYSADFESAVTTASVMGARLIVNSFLIAAHYGIYFETLPPLRKFLRRCKKLSGTLYKELLIPLFEKREGTFKDSDKINIHRMLDEFGINMEVDLEQSSEQIIRAFKRLSKK